MAEMDKLFEHIDDIEIAMLTTRRPDGHLCSRAMATQKRAAGADLWFVTLEDTGKLDEIAFDPHVNLSYYKDRTREWVSVSGIATISRDRDTDPRAVGARTGRRGSRRGTIRGMEPRTIRGWCSIGVDVHAAAFLEVNKPQPVVLFELAKG